jgi:hypothetical protein
MDINEQIMTYLKQHHGVPLMELASQVKKSEDYIMGVMESSISKTYLNKNGIIVLNGLGDKLCVVCGEENDWKSMPIRIPDEILKGRQVNPSTLNGHKKCYETIDVFFRVDNILSCIDCSNFSGEWIDGDEVLEECYKHKFKESGHQGVIAGNKMCNFFSPDMYMRDEKNPKYVKERKVWNEIKSNIEERTLKGYQNLITILEKSTLITDKK